MIRLATLVAAFTVAALSTVLAALPVAAAASPAGAHALSAPAFDDQDGHELVTTASGDSGQDVVPRVAWTLAGVAASVVGLSGLYLLKRRLGGFPKNPAWVAPITIMPSSELPGDRDPHEAETHGHNEPAHAGH